MANGFSHRSVPRVLVVDDEPFVRKLLAQSLSNEGFEIVEAEDGDVGVEAFSAESPDLVLMDVQMDRMNGFDACAAIRRLPGGGHLPIMMMTGLDDLESIRRAYEAGATDFVTKPVNWFLLAQRLRYILRATRAFTDLAETEAKNRALLRAMPDRVYRIARDGSILDVVSGDGRDLAGSSLATLFLPEVSKTALSCIANALSSREVQAFEYEAVEDGEARHFDARVVALDNDEILYIARDQTEKMAAEERLDFLAWHDELTGLPNRAFFNARLGADVLRARRRQETIAVVVVDVDKFQEVNDAVGHANGDRFLKEVAARLTARIRDTDTASRSSVDEFWLILPDQPDADHAVAAARRLRHAFDEPFVIEGHTVTVTASIGVSLFPLGADDPGTLIKQTDLALARAKAQGRDTVQIFSEEISKAVEKRADIERGLKDALANREFVVFYQPEIDLSTGAIVGAEALIRWMRPGRGMVPPLDFISVAEETGAIIPITEWILFEAARQAKAWRDAGFDGFRVAVNISGKHFQQEGFPDLVARVLEGTGLPPDGLQVEITESIAMQNLDIVVDALWAVQKMGVSCAMDDFGTGYSSLAYLKKFPIDLLKIDRAFIKDMLENEGAHALVEAIVAMAKALKMETIAEGVETAGHATFLKWLGCDKGQGFLFSRPVPAADFEKLPRSFEIKA